MNPKLALALLCLAAAPCGAQTAPAVAAPPAPAASAAAAPAVETTEPGEPNVRHIVVEDKGAKIEELRVRGSTQRIVVTPKVGTTKSYEILTDDGSRNLTDSANPARGSVGKRVWNVLAF